MVEVFKTNVQDKNQADRLIDKIALSHRDYLVNFDLEDCDRILRVTSPNGVKAGSVIKLVQASGYEAEVLPDEIPSIQNLFFTAEITAQ